jgi:hypothetical protein
MLSHENVKRVPIQTTSYRTDETFTNAQKMLQLLTMRDATYEMGGPNLRTEVESLEKANTYVPVPS